MSELGRLLRNEAGPGSLPWRAVAAGAAVMLVVCTRLDWRWARQERVASKTSFPKPQRPRPLAWIVPATELNVVPRPAEGRRAV